MCVCVEQPTDDMTMNSLSLAGLNYVVVQKGRVVEEKWEFVVSGWVESGWCFGFMTPLCVQRKSDVAAIFVFRLFCYQLT